MVQPSISQTLALSGGAFFFQYAIPDTSTLQLEFSGYAVTDSVAQLTGGFLQFAGENANLEITISNSAFSNLIANLKRTVEQTINPEGGGGGFAEISAKNFVLNIGAGTSFT